MKTNVVLPLILVALLGIAGVYVLQTQRHAPDPLRQTVSQGLIVEKPGRQEQKNARKPGQHFSLTYYVARETETDLTLEGELVNPLPHGTVFIGVVVDQGLATVNLNTAFRDNFNGGAREEQVTVYSIVNTLCDISEIKAVRFEIAGQPIEEYAGHLDLSEPLAPDMSIVEPAR